LASEANTLSTELQPHLNEAGKDTGFQSGSPRKYLSGRIETASSSIISRFAA